jgi:hypothetical protein
LARSKAQLADLWHVDVGSLEMAVGKKNKNGPPPYALTVGGYGIQTRQRRCENMATIEGRKSVAQCRPRRQIPKRHRGHHNAGSPRRLIDLVTQSPA